MERKSRLPPCVFNSSNLNRQPPFRGAEWDSSENIMRMLTLQEKIVLAVAGSVIYHSSNRNAASSRSRVSARRCGPRVRRRTSIGTRVQPLLERNCLACHNAKVKQGGLDLSSRDALLGGSEHGPVVVPGTPNDSPLYKARSSQTKAIAKFAEWIKLGVSYGDAVEDPAAVSRAEAEKHWAFRQPVRPAVPAVQEPRGRRIRSMRSSSRSLPNAG